MNQIKRSQSFSENRESTNEIKKIINKRQKLYNQFSKIKFNEQIDVVYFKSENPSDKNIVIQKENLRTYKYEILRNKFLQIYQIAIFPHLYNLIKFNKKQFWEYVYKNMVLEDELSQENYKDIAKQRLINNLDHLIETSKLYIYTYIGTTQIPLHVMKPVLINNKWVWEKKQKITKYLQEFKKIINN